MGGQVIFPAFAALTGTLVANSTIATNAAGTAWELRDVSSATSLTSGTLPDARLSSNVPLKNASNTFTGSLQTMVAEAFSEAPAVGTARVYRRWAKLTGQPYDYTEIGRVSANASGDADWILARGVNIGSNFLAENAAKHMAGDFIESEFEQLGTRLHERYYRFDSPAAAQYRPWALYMRYDPSIYFEHLYQVDQLELRATNAAYDAAAAWATWNATTLTYSGDIQFDTAVGDKIRLYSTTFGLGISASEYVLWAGTGGHFGFRNTSRTGTQVATISTDNGAYTVASGTITASAPPFSATQTWNNSGVTFNGFFLNVTNTASDAASKLIDLQIGGVTQFNVTRAGAITSTGGLSTTTGAFSSTLSGTVVTGSTAFRGPNGSAGTPSFSFTNDTDVGIYYQSPSAVAFTSSGTRSAYIDGGGMGINNLYRLTANSQSEFVFDNGSNANGLVLSYIANKTTTGVTHNCVAIGAATQWGTASWTSTSGTFRALAIVPTINQGSGTASNTLLYIMPTITAHGSGADYLIQAGVGGSDYFTVSTTGAMVVTTSGTKQIETNATGIGFFAATPAAKPTGVAVTAAGIHAALVTLGLIAA